MSGDVTNKPSEEEYLEIDLRKPWIAVICAWVFPGAGHFYQRRYVKGLIFMICIMATYIAGFIMGGGHVVYVSWQKHHWRWEYICQLGIGLPALPALVQCYRAPGLELREEIRKEIRGVDYDHDKQVSKEELEHLLRAKTDLLKERIEDAGADPFQSNRLEREIKELEESHDPARLLSRWDRNRDDKISLVDELPQGKPWFNSMMVPPGEIMPSNPDQLAEWHATYGSLFDLGTLYTMIAGLLNLLAIFDAHAGPLIFSKEDKKDRKKSAKKRMKFN